MKTLKEAINLASDDADGDGDFANYFANYSSWASAFTASLESSGYCIVPMEATGKIGKAMKLCEDGSRSIREAYQDIIAARPKIGD
jgi:hypothetical protein